MWALGVHVPGTNMRFFTNPYCVIDFIIVMLDVVSLMATSLPDSIGDNVLILRIVRLIRLARLLKVMRIMKKLRDEMLKKKEVPPWVLPSKFKHAPQEMLDSMTGMVTVTRKMADLFEDQQLQALLSELVQRLSQVHSQEELEEMESSYVAEGTGGVMGDALDSVGLNPLTGVLFGSDEVTWKYPLDACNLWSSKYIGALHQRTLHRNTL
jgi:hypothetical protein